MHYLKHTLILFAALSLGLTSCSKNDEAPSTKSIITQGKWKVILFKDNGAVETSQYNGYEFKFNSNGQIEAIKSGTTVTGTWSVGADENKNRLMLTFPITTLSPLPDLNHDWGFTKKSYTVVELEYENDATGTDVLTLEKL